MPLILASASPRRRQLMAFITPHFEVMTSEADETLPPGAPPRRAVELLSARKARAAAMLRPDGVVIGSDTVVALEDDTILGKPKDDPDAKRMLRLLSGRWHRVYTGVCVISDGRETVFSDMARVLFDRMDEGEIDCYIATGEGRDKAGAYAIQGIGARHIRGVEGDFYTVMGLPVNPLYKTLKGLGAI